MSYVCIRKRQSSLTNGYKNGCRGINRDFVSTKIVPTANIVTTILISKTKSQFRLVVFPSIG